MVGGRFDPFYNDAFYTTVDIKIENCNYPHKYFKDLCYSVSGVIYSSNDERSFGKTILRGNNISLNSNEINFESIRYIREDFDIAEELKLKKNDILMSSASGSKEHVGKVAYIESDLDYYFGGFMMVLRKKIIAILNDTFLNFYKAVYLECIYIKILGEQILII